MARVAKRGVRGTATPAASAPARLVMSLYMPGMSILHRAGLGGLAATLRKIESEFQARRLCAAQLPGAPWKNGPPWTIDTRTVTLDFGEPDAAGEYLRRLFEFAFGLKDDLIYLPGQYKHAGPPPVEVRAYLQQGATLTFLQHGRVRKLGAPTTMQYAHPDGDDKPTIHFEFRACGGYKHRDAWRELVDKQGRLKREPAEVIGPLNPGAVVRHNAFPAKTKIEEGPAHLIPLYFALVGCLALPINRGSGVLLVPDVPDLPAFVTMRPFLTPDSARECQIASAGDAALQAQVRLKAKVAVHDWDLPGCHAATFQPTSWASQQKSRANTMLVPAGREIQLEVFAKALQALEPRVVVRTTTEVQGRGRARKVTERKESFWANSIVRPLVANNLANGRPWYQGFVELMTRIDPVTRKPLRDRLAFERKGLHTMTERIAWSDRGEEILVRAVHKAIERRYAQIADENRSNSAAMKNRWNGEYDRWRLAFAGAKTANQFRTALCDLFSRGRANAVLQTDWQALLPMLDQSRWQLTRDLALLGLASYAGRGAKDTAPPDIELSRETE